VIGGKLGIYRCGVVPDLKQQDVVRQTLAHVRVMSALQADIAETRARSTVDIA